MWLKRDGSEDHLGVRALSRVPWTFHVSIDNFKYNADLHWASSPAPVIECLSKCVWESFWELEGSSRSCAFFPFLFDDCLPLMSSRHFEERHRAEVFGTAKWGKRRTHCPRQAWSVREEVGSTNFWPLARLPRGPIAFLASCSAACSTAWGHRGFLAEKETRRIGVSNAVYSILYLSLSFCQSTPSMVTLLGIGIRAFMMSYSNAFHWLSTTVYWLLK